MSSYDELVVLCNEFRQHAEPDFSKGPADYTDEAMSHFSFPFGGMFSAVRQLMGLDRADGRDNANGETTMRGLEVRIHPHATNHPSQSPRTFFSPLTPPREVLQRT